MLTEICLNINIVDVQMDISESLLRVLPKNSKMPLMLTVLQKVHIDQRDSLLCICTLVDSNISSMHEK